MLKNQSKEKTQPNLILLMQIVYREQYNLNQHHKIAQCFTCIRPSKPIVPRNCVIIPLPMGESNLELLLCYHLLQCNGRYRPIVVEPNLISHLLGCLRFQSSDSMASRRSSPYDVAEKTSVAIPSSLSFVAAISTCEV